VSTYDIPLLIRGKLITDNMIEFKGRGGELVFRSPDVERYLDQIPLSEPVKMADMYELTFDDIVHYLAELGRRLNTETNPYLREAFELSCKTSSLSANILRFQYDQVMPSLFAPEHVREVAETRIGIATLEGWTRQELNDGRVAYTRPLGARGMHVTAGNSPLCAAITVLWSCITRSDAVIKSPSNDPLTSLAIGRTMLDFAPDHPLTKHYSVAYWKGGNVDFESKIYSPENFEKIVAWGGFSSMKHITRYIQPGLELVAMDPKLSGTIIGREAFDSDETMRHVAELIAVDFGSFNQEGCANARVISVQSGTDKAGLERLNKLAEYTYEALQRLPVEISEPVKVLDSELKEEMLGIRDSSFYRIVGDIDNRGAVIVSQIPDPVDFAPLLACRVANFVPCDKIDEAVELVTVHTQTIGVYPESLKKQYREKLAFMGGQRIVSLGAHVLMNWSLPHDAMEPVRRLCRWINDEDCSVDSFQAAAWPAQSCVAC